MASKPSNLSKIAIKRAMKEMTISDMDHAETASEGYWILFDKEDISKVQLLIKGPDDTPYEGGFFHFNCVLPDNYPFTNPKCTYMTTGQAKIRFNPNLYKCGKVCLSILGTWQGPAWSSAMNMRTLCMNLQLVLNEYPVHNEPGYEKAKPDSVTVCSYNKYVRYNCLKHAILDHLTKKSKLPTSFQKVVEDFSKEKGIDYYLSLVEKFEKESQVKGIGAEKIYMKSDIEGISYKWSELSESFKVLGGDSQKSGSESSGRTTRSKSRAVDSNNNDNASDELVDLTEAVSKSSVIDLTGD